MPARAVHYAKAWPQLRRLAERLAIPVTTSLAANPPFRRPIRCRWVRAASPLPRAVPKFLGEADVIFGIGCSFTETSFGIAMPKGKTIIHSTLDPNHLNKGCRGQDRPGRRCRARTRRAIGRDRQDRHTDRDATAVAAEIAASHKELAGKMDAEAHP